MAHARLVHESTHDGVRILTMADAPVNALGLALRLDLIDALETAEADPTVHAVILRGMPRVFSAGADLRELDESAGGFEEPSLQCALIPLIEGMSKPVIAALAGAVLAGGCELALACHYRVAAPGTTFGLPESELGMIPGAGGTQRLPRAIGVENALNMMVSGAPTLVTAKTAVGFADSIAKNDSVEEVLRAAIEFAGRIAAERPLPRLRDRAVQHPSLEAFLGFVLTQGRHHPVKGRAITTIVAAITSGSTAKTFDAGLAEEERSFRELSQSTTAKALRYAFFAQRQAGRLPGTSNSTANTGSRTAARTLSSAAVIGAGTMGRGIALALLAADLPVTLVDFAQDRVDAGLAAISAEISRLAERGRLSPQQATERLGRISGATDLKAIRDRDLVIEAVFEKLDVKKAVFADLDATLKPGAVLASNTSSLDVDVIAQATKRPEDVVGLHFFSPANVMKLVEVVRGKKTSLETLAEAVALVKRLGKIAVISRVGPGFIGNRLVDAMTRQAVQLVLEGATPSAVDAALEKFGMRMGPFRVFDLVGNDIPALTRVAAGEEGDPDWEVADELVARGWLGHKAGRGWYRYDERLRASPDPDVAELIATVQATRGTVPRASITESEIVDRCIFALVNEGAAALSEGIAMRASDIDVVYLNGYGFPPARGGPMFYADTVGLANVVRRMRFFARTVPFGAAFWQPHPLIIDLAQSRHPLSAWSETP